MSMNNIKLLTEDELSYLNDKYLFEIDENGDVVVGNKYYNRKTVHAADKTFSLNTRVKRISFNPSIICLWKKLNQDGTKCTLFDVKQAITKLYLEYQDITDSAIKRKLEEETK